MQSFLIFEIFSVFSIIVWIIIYFYCRLIYSVCHKSVHYVKIFSLLHETIEVYLISIREGYNIQKLFINILKQVLELS
jgi:hypothetical protein